MYTHAHVFPYMHVFMCAHPMCAHMYVCVVAMTPSCGTQYVDVGGDWGVFPGAVWTWSPCTRMVRCSWMCWLWLPAGVLRAVPLGAGVFLSLVVEVTCSR